MAASTPEGRDILGEWYTKQSKYIQKNLQQIILKIIKNFRIPPNLSPPLYPEAALDNPETSRQNQNPPPRKNSNNKKPQHLKRHWGNLYT
jgi:hypothetical protein